MNGKTPILSDEHLVARVRLNQDPEAFEQLHTRYRKKILNYMFRYLGNYQKAEDLTQEVFIAVYRSIPRLRSIDNISSWIYTIATNQARMEFRKKKSETVSLNVLFSKSDGGQVELLDLIANNTKRPDRLIHQQNLEVRFQQATMQLPKKFREVFMLCALQGLSYAEAADILNTRKKTVSTRLYRARRRIALILEREPTETSDGQRS